VELELWNLDEVPASAKKLLDQHHDVTALVWNAAIMGGPFLLSAQGFELQMATDHFGHVALVAGVWPLLVASSARVVFVTSNEGKRGQLSRTMTSDRLLKPEPYDRKQVYRNTKPANVLFAQDLYRRCEQNDSKVSAVAAHPGAASTNLLARQLDRAGRPLLARVEQGSEWGRASLGGSWCAHHASGVGSEPDELDVLGEESLNRRRATMEMHVGEEHLLTWQLRRG
jgi:NAD(P)-dependent dehydrogenase (short-subunit alcohol dehydrogenase family)